MTRIELNQLYDRLCSALTDYELDPNTGFPPADTVPHDAGEALYLAVMDIVEDMTNKMF